MEQNAKKCISVMIPKTLMQLRELVLRKDIELNLPMENTIYNQMKPLLNLEETSLTYQPMIVIMWNCRGAASQGFMQAFKDMVDFHKPTLVILIETKLSGARATKVISRLGFQNHTHTDGNSRGIFILSNNDIIGETLMLTR